MQSRSQRIQKKVFAKSFCMRLLSYSILYYILHFSVHKIFFTFITSESLSVSYIIAIAARWTKSVKFTLSIAVHTGVPAKNHFWLVATRKKRISAILVYTKTTTHISINGGYLKRHFAAW